MSKQNMYVSSVAQWNPQAGCEFDCRYCRLSFQLQLKRWGKENCTQCYQFVPHEHRERLNQPLPKTQPGQFIFTCASGDIAFSTTEYFRGIADRIRREPKKTFLLQSKDPRTFNRIEIPDNVMIGTTLETNRDGGYGEISKAPLPSQRYRDFADLKHDTKMVTIEPVLDFDDDVLVEWLTHIHPSLIWLGYDSRKSHLPEPPLAKVQDLHERLTAMGFKVVLKTVRRAWWEVGRASSPRSENMSAKTKCGVQNVAASGLSPLARWILQRAGAGDGIARGQIAEEFFGLARFYRGFYVDPCLTRTQRRDRDRANRRVQPAITKTLKRLEAAGLIELVRCNRYAKLIRLTEKGITLARDLNNAAGVTGHGSCHEICRQSTQ